ncbi:MAG: endonuclease MutS2 [Desulfonatronovibrionaceae bacterium]
MEQTTANLLEFPKVLDHLSRKAVSNPGKQMCLDVSFNLSREELDLEYGLLREIMRCKKEYAISLGDFPDMRPVLKSLKNQDAVLQVEDFWEWKAFFREAGRVYLALEGVDEQSFPGLKSLRSGLHWPARFFDALKRCIGDAGEIRDESSPGLYEVRKEIRAIRQACSKKVDDSLSHPGLVQYLQDEYLTISSDRYVLALKANFKGRIQGIIHDYSQTGETCYFEPLFLTELNNKLQRLKKRERLEMGRVLEYLTGLCLDAENDSRALFEWLARMDFLLAKAGFAQELRAVPLEVSRAGGNLTLKNIRHPLLVLGGHEAVPIDVRLKQGQRALVISGGNAGGKTVCLKTLGLAALMALSALPVPADEGSRIPRWSKIFVSMVSSQSVEDSLSTFTSQIHHFSGFWPEVDENTLIILDEFGLGTDPGQGAALAQAVVDAVLEKKAWLAAATHFPALKAYALSRPEVRAASVLFHQQTGNPMYRLGYDQAGASLALEVARKQGLDSWIISRAEEYLLVDGRKQDEIFSRLNALAQEKDRELENIRQKEKELEKEQQKLAREMRADRDRLVREVREISQKILRQWQENKTGRKKALKELAAVRNRIDGQQERKTAQKAEALDPGQIKTGDRLLYQPWQKTGVVQEMDGSREQVKMDLGGISIWVRFKDLENPQPEQNQKSQGLAASTSFKPLPMKLDLRGKYPDEAQGILEEYLDRALLSGRKKLEIIHGKGTGVLRTTVHDCLRQNPAVEEFRCCHDLAGGEGMTEVELK